MNKILYIFLLFIFISNCSLDNATGIWTKSEKLNSENKIIEEKLFEDEELTMFYKDIVEQFKNDGEISINHCLRL